VFGAYFIPLGVMLLIIPNVLLAMFGIPGTDEVWIRVLGATVVVLGFYYISGGRAQTTWFLRASVFGRTFGALVLFVLVLLGLAPLTFLLFGMVDLAGAAWTAYALGWVRVLRG
jgi:hypothetical protein